MKRMLIAVFVAAAAATSFALVATETLIVTSTNTRGWSTADTRPGGTVGFVLDASAPAGTGALQLTTNALTTAKAQYMHASTTPLADVTDLSYSSKQNSAAFSGGAPSYRLPYLCVRMRDHRSRHSSSSPTRTAA